MKKSTQSTKNLRVCSKGHKYYKSSSCPVCPICDKENAPHEGFLSELSAPARRALENAEITTLHKLSQYKESEILELHGLGPSTIPILRKALKSKELVFAKKSKDTTI